jgi:hypothetical protein
MVMLFLEYPRRHRPAVAEELIAEWLITMVTSVY